MTASSHQNLTPDACTHRPPCCKCRSIKAAAAHRHVRKHSSSTLFRSNPPLNSSIMSKSQIQPSIHYWGTPVVLITTTNEDGSSNIGPMSSAWWLGGRCMLGLEHNSKTTENLRRTKQCTLNLASDDMLEHVNALARTTGSDPVPDFKIALG